MKIRTSKTKKLNLILYRKKYYSDVIELKDVIVPFLGIIGFLSLLFLVTIVFDDFEIKKIINYFVHPDNATISDVFGNAFGGMMVGVMALIATVVAFIIEMAANRYTSKIIDLFMNDKVNLFFMTLSSVTTVYVIFLLYLGNSSKIMPQLSIFICFVLVGILLISVFPYFIYVFRFIRPGNIIYRIESEIFKNVLSCFKVKGKQKTKTSNFIHQLHKKVLHGINELTDISLNCVQNKDQTLAMDCVRSIRYLMTNYMNLQVKSPLPKQWLAPSPAVEMDVSFITLSEENIEGTSKFNLWLEDKLLKQLELIFRTSINVDRNTCNFIAKSLYILGVTALHIQNYEIIRRIIRYFNTFLRATITEHDTRTSFNVLNQYKKLTLELIEARENTITVQIVNYFKYYGLLAKEMNMYLILETVAHDICEINKKAYEVKLEKRDELLDIFLTVDMPLEGEKGDSLRGIRKAQVILAVYYLNQKSAEGLLLARKVYWDMLDELHRVGGYIRIFNIIKELKYVKQEYWEINDRGFNYDYISPNEKSLLVEFLKWFICRLIVLYAYNKVLLSDEFTADKYIKEIKKIKLSLPTEPSVETIEFESILGYKNLDTKRNYTNNILELKDYLLNPSNLRKEIVYHPDLKSLKLENKLEKMKNGIELFFVAFGT